MTPHQSQTCSRSFLRRGALSLIALLSTLIILLVALPAWAQTPAPSREHTKSTECIRVHDPDLHFVDEETKAEKHFAVVSYNNDAPNCGIRNAYRMFPILDEDGKPLSIQDWLRSVYAANQEGKNPTMRRGCDPRSPATADATIEEQKYCAGHYVNYFGIASNGWRAIINIPRTRWYTFFEQQAAVAANACTELEKIPNPTPEVTKTLADCRKAHSIGTPPAPPQTTVCGNGQVEAGEQCDDSNAVGGDGCSATCQTEKPDPSTLQKMLDEAKAKVAALTERVAELETLLAAATSFRPFRPNAWLAMLVAGGLVFVLVYRSQTKKGRRLMDELVASGIREGELSARLAQALAKVQDYVTIEANNSLLSDQVKKLEEANKKAGEEVAGTIAKMEQQAANHVAIVQTMHDERAKADKKQAAEHLKDIEKRDANWGKFLADQSREDRANFERQLAAKLAQTKAECARSADEEKAKLQDENDLLFVRIDELEVMIRRNEEYSLFLLAWILERDPKKAPLFDIDPAIEARLEDKREYVRELMQDDTEAARVSLAPPPFLPITESTPPPGRPSTHPAETTSTPTTETFHPTTEKASPPVYAPTPKGAPYRKTTLQFPSAPVPSSLANLLGDEASESPAGTESDVLRSGLMDVLRILDEHATEVVEGADDEDLAKSAVTLASAVKSKLAGAERAKDIAEEHSQVVSKRWEDSEKAKAASEELPPASQGYVMSSLDELDGLGLACYLRNIFSEVWLRIRKFGEEFEMVLVSREEVRAVCASLKSVKLLLSPELAQAVGDDVQEVHCLNDVFTLARLLKMSDTPLLPRLHSASSIVSKTLVPGPKGFPIPNGTDGEPGPVR